MRQARRVLGESCELWVRTVAREDPGVTLGEGSPTLALKRTGDDRRPAARGARVNDLIDEVDKIVWKPNGDLLAHPNMVDRLPLFARSSSWQPPN
jgi:hypothetical protein